MVTRSRSIRRALASGGVERALSTMADDLATRLDECADPDERLSLTRAFLVVCRDLSINERAKHKAQLEAAKAAPAPKAASLSLVESLQAERDHA